jgi:hypothetical protein
MSQARAILATVEGGNQPRIGGFFTTGRAGRGPEGWPEGCSAPRRTMPSVLDHDSETRPTADSCPHSHALELLLQWQLLRSAIDQVKQTSLPPPSTNDTGPKLAA